DAAAIASALRQVGFQTVRLEQDLPREKLIEALRSFAREADSADWALVYFAGHGIEANGTNYLVPVDAKLEVDRDIVRLRIAAGRGLLLRDRQTMIVAPHADTVGSAEDPSASSMLTM